MGLNINSFIAIFRTFLKYKNHDIGMKLAFASIAGGITLLVSGVGLNVLIATQYFDLPVLINNNIPGWISYLGAGLVIFGCVVGAMRIRYLQRHITGILIVHRGMEGMNVTDVRGALPGAFSKGKLEIIDLHEGHQLHNGSMVAPERALDVVNGIDQQIKTRINGRDNSHVRLAYGGLAPIPLLVTAGYKVTSRQECVTLDYSRTNGWHGLDDADDDERIEITPPVGKLG
ncbi:MAG TPA: SAVED domain-containing protein, partial [Gammaproteobacteria bacterium]|nr:SAVED domain-containing protein [Gammaproteobacteria bacterium]